MKRFFVIVMAGLFLSFDLYAQHTRPGHDWTVNSTAFDFNMTIVVQVQHDGVVDASLEIGAFCGEECRGTVKAKYETVLDKYVWYLVIHGNAGDPINFYVRQAGVELDAETNYSLVFVANNIIGNPVNPLVINFTSSAPHDYLLVTDPSQLVAGRDLLFSTTKVLDVDNATAITLESWEIDVKADGTARLVSLSSDEKLEGYLFAQCVFISGAYDILDVTNAQTMYVVPSGSTLTVDELNTVDVSNLIVEDGAQLVNASPSVRATLQKNISAYADIEVSDGWYTVAAPLRAVDVDLNSNMTAFEYDLYEFDETNLTHEEWRNYKVDGNFENFTPGRGYLYANDHDVTLNMFGPLNAANVTVVMTYTADRPDELKGFNLIGNPYPHAIYKGHGAAIDDNRLSDGYYLLSNDGAWQVKTYSDPILPGQGVLVMTAEAGDFTIAKTTALATAESSTSKGRSTDHGRISLRVSDGASEDVAYLYGTMEGRNLRKIPHLNNDVPELSFCLDRERFAIAHVDDSLAAVEVRFDNRKVATYTMTWDLSEWQGGHPYLIDHFTGAEIGMLNQSSYTFEANGHEHPFRFQLVLDKALEGTVTVFPDFQGEGVFQVIDLSGRVVFSQQGGNVIDTWGLAPGVYVVRLIEGDRERMEKILVR